MPNIKAAWKSLRQNKKRNLSNRIVISELRTLAKDAHTLIVEKKREEADAALKLLESKLYKAAQSNVVKKNSAARKVSRLRSQWAKIEKKK